MTQCLVTAPWTCGQAFFQSDSKIHRERDVLSVGGRTDAVHARRDQDMSGPPTDTWEYKETCQAFQRPVASLRSSTSDEIEAAAFCSYCSVLLPVRRPLRGTTSLIHLLKTSPNPAAEPQKEESLASATRLLPRHLFFSRVQHTHKLAVRPSHCDSSPSPVSSEDSS